MFSLYSPMWVRNCGWRLVLGAFFLYQLGFGATTTATNTTITCNNKPVHEDSGLALQSTLVFLFHTIISCPAISQSVNPSLSYPFCPLLKPVLTDSLPGVPVPGGHAQCHRAKWPLIGIQREPRRHQPQDNIWGLVLGARRSLMLSCLTLAGWLPSPLVRAHSP